MYCVWNVQRAICLTWPMCRGQGSTDIVAKRHRIKRRRMGVKVPATEVLWRKCYTPGGYFRQVLSRIYAKGQVYFIGVNI